MDFNLSAVKEKLGAVRNLVMNYSEIESKVRDATNNDAWGASGTIMTEIAQATHNIDDFNAVMETLYKRFAEHGKNWRQVYKALTLLEYLVKNGHERVVHNARDHQYEIKGLSHFEYIDEKGKDQGINVRNRSKEIVALLNDPERIKEERRTAKKNRDKYVGVSSDSVDRYSSSKPSNRGVSNGDSEDFSFGSRSDTPEPYRGDDDDDRNGGYSQVRTETPSKAPAARAAPAASKPAADDFGNFNAAPSTTSNGNGFASFDSFPAPAAAKAKPADDFAGFQAAPATSAAPFAAFQAAPAPAPAPAMSLFSAPVATAPQANASLNFGFAAPASAPRGAPAPSSQVLDPFGDIPAGESLPGPAISASGLLQPMNKPGAPATATPSSGGKADGWADKGLVDLDNLKKFNPPPKKEEHKPMQPNAKPTSGMAQPMMAPPMMQPAYGAPARPMAPGYGAPMGAGFGAPAYGAPGGFGAPAYGAPMGAGFGAPAGAYGAQPGAFGAPAYGAPAGARPPTSNPGWGSF